MGNTEKDFGNTSIWLSIDSEKVKQRIELITKQLVKVLQKVEPETKATDPNHQS
ncbi:MAG: hypothetical protein LDL41_18285 [Coleofasciculus sp. S288]|nr:hypothetical protein [Coleofasciculus sp. S288]